MKFGVGVLQWNTLSEFHFDPFSSPRTVLLALFTAAEPFGQ
jgi:hypothetical protein